MTELQNRHIVTRYRCLSRVANSSIRNKPPIRMQRMSLKFYSIDLYSIMPFKYHFVLDIKDRLSPLKIQEDTPLADTDI